MSQNPIILREQGFNYDLFCPWIKWTSGANKNVMNSVNYY